MISDKIEEYPLIIMDDVNYTYPSGDQALKNIRLTIDKGELIAIMGKNGAGKTTLIRTLNGLIRPQKGEIYINEKPIKNKTIASISKRVGIIFQNPDHQLFSSSVEEEIKFSLNNIYKDKNLINDNIERVLEEFEFVKYRDRSPLNLSGGEKKKLALASIICRDPDILIFDEPTLGQDDKEIHFFIKLIQEEILKGKTIVIVTHNVEFALEYIPRLILMFNGEIIADGPCSKVLNNTNLINRASLVSPQITRIKKILEDEGFFFQEKPENREDIIEILEKIIIQSKI